MTTYKVTERVLSLVEQLSQEGYTGEATFSNRYSLGAKEVLGVSFSLQLTGFCKETLHLTEDSDGNIVFVGRYCEERRDPDASVQDIVRIAWKKYQSYKIYSSYSRPYEFDVLFEKYGYITKKTQIVESIIEKG